MTDKTGVTERAYDELGRTKSKTISNIGEVKFIYDNIEGLEKGYPSEITKDTYDKAGNRETETINEKGNSIVTIYSYNEQNRLLGTVKKQGAVILGFKNYEYDNNGNVIKETGGVADFIVPQPLEKRIGELFENPGRLNEIIKEEIKDQVLANTVVEITTRILTNDNSKFKQKEIQYFYDEFNQLIEAKNETGTILRNKYNGEGLRIVKEQGETKTNYLYEEDKVILEVDGNSGKEKARNIYGTTLISRKVDETTAYYMYNGHGDVTNLLDEKGNVIGSYYYDAFGNIKESTGSFKNPYRYSGYQYDEEIGKYYLMSRMYDPESARFMQEDTYRGDPNDPLSLNLYTYCHNEPMMYSDPSGHWRISSICSGISNFFSKTYDAVADWVSNRYDELTERVSNKYHELTEWVSDTWREKKEEYTEIYNNVETKVENLVEGVKATNREVIQNVKQVVNDLPDMIPKIAKFVGGAISLGAGVAATAAGIALLPTGIGTGLGLVLIGAGVISGAYGLSEIGEAFTGKNPLKDFAVNKIGISEETYTVIGIIATGASTYGLGSAAMLTTNSFNKQTRVALPGGGSVRTNEVLVEEVGANTVELNQVQKNYWAAVNDRSNSVVTKGVRNPSYENVSPYSTSKWTEYFNSKYGAENVSLKGTDPADFLNSALSRQGLNTAPAKLKETWIQDGYKYEVRIHPAEAQYGKTNSIYRVSRQNVEIPNGVEYMGTDGNWYHTSVLKPGKNGNINANFNNEAAEMTHIQLP